MSSALLVLHCDPLSALTNAQKPPPASLATQRKTKWLQLNPTIDMSKKNVGSQPQLQPAAPRTASSPLLPDWLVLWLLQQPHKLMKLLFCHRQLLGLAAVLFKLNWRHVVLPLAVGKHHKQHIVVRQVDLLWLSRCGVVAAGVCDRQAAGVSDSHVTALAVGRVVTRP